MIRIQLLAVLMFLAIGVISTSEVMAGPPSYLLLRDSASPRPPHQPGEPDAQYYQQRTTGYAYGWFGACPRTHATRHFGIYREYTQWSFR